MKFIHIADVHLGAKPDRGRIWSDTRAEEIKDSFVDVLRVCEAEQVDLLLIAGDLFHSQPTLSQLKELDYMLGRMKGTKTVIVAGDHDYIDEDSAWNQYQFSSEAILLPKDQATNVYMEDLNVCITGFSYGKDVYSERVLEKLRPGRADAYNILLGHGGDKQHMPFSTERLAESGFHYYALGHIHKPTEVLANRIVFPGSLEPLGYSEVGKHGYILGEVAQDGTTTATWIPHCRREYMNLAFTLTPEHTNAGINEMIETKLLELGKENIYRILLKGQIDSELILNISALQKNYNINEILDHTECGYSVQELAITNADNLLGGYLQAFSGEELDEKQEKALKYGLNALMGVKDR